MLPSRDRCNARDEKRPRQKAPVDALHNTATVHQVHHNKPYPVAQMQWLYVSIYLCRYLQANNTGSIPDTGTTVYNTDTWVLLILLVVPQVPSHFTRNTPEVGAIQPAQ